MANSTDSKHPLETVLKHAGLLLFVVGLAFVLLYFRVAFQLVFAFLVISIAWIIGANKTLLPEIWRLGSGDKAPSSQPEIRRKPSRYELLLEHQLAQVLIIFLLSLACFFAQRSAGFHAPKIPDSVANDIEKTYELEKQIQTQISKNQTANHNPGGNDQPCPSFVNCPQLCDQLAQCLQKATGKSAAGGSTEVRNPTLQLDPALKKELKEYLARGQARQGESFSWGAIGFRAALVLLLIVIAVALLVPLAKKHPSIAAPIGAVGLASLAIKNAEHLSHFDPGTLSSIVDLFRVVAIFLLVICVIQIFMPQQGDHEKMEQLDAPPETAKETSASDDDAAGKSAWYLRVSSFIRKFFGWGFRGKGDKPEEKASESKVANSPLSVAFSLTVLVWALVLVAHQQEKNDRSAVPTTATIITRSPHEETISDFALGSSDAEQSKVEQLDAALSPYIHEKGDLLLLLGSADCSERQHGSNRDLAYDRARKVKRILEGLPSHPEFNIEADALDQHKNCQKSGDLRAVFPILIRAQAGDAASAGPNDRH